MGLVLMGVVMVILVACVPAWRHSRHWGFGPSGACAIVLLIILVLMWFGVIGPALQVPD